MACEKPHNCALDMIIAGFGISGVAVCCGDDDDNDNNDTSVSNKTFWHINLVVAER